MDSQSLVIPGETFFSQQELDIFYIKNNVASSNVDRLFFYNCSFPSGVSFSTSTSPNLPKRLKRLIFHKNHLPDSSLLEVSSSLPRDVEWLDFSGNSLTKLNLLPLSRKNIENNRNNSNVERDDDDESVESTSLSVSAPLSSANQNNHLYLINLRVLDLSNNKLKHLPDLTRLPPALERFDISKNKITDKNPDLAKLPQHLEFFDISSNEISWSALAFSSLTSSKSLDFSHLPQTIRLIDISRNVLGGPVPDLSLLPESLTFLDMSHNKFTGSASTIPMLPAGLQILDLSKNKFEATTPSLAATGALSLKRLSMSSCRFVTTPNMDKLPPFLEILDFSKNKIIVPPTFPSVSSSSSSLQRMPFCFRKIDFSNNELRGPVPDFSNLPPSCRHIDFSNNQLSGHGGCDFSKLPKSLIHLDLSNNKINSFRGKIDLTTLPRNLEHFDMSNNDIDGELILYYQNSASSEKKELPEYLERILLSGNKIKGTVDLLHLNQHLMRIELAENNIEFLEGGSKCFANLPPVLDSVDLNRNQIAIDGLDLSVVPANIEQLFLGENKFSGTIDLSLCSRSLKQLFLNSNQLKFRLDLKDICALDNLSIVDLSDNQLFGVLDLKHLATRNISGWTGGSGNKKHSVNVSNNNFGPIDEDEDDVNNDGKLVENQYFAVQF